MSRATQENPQQPEYETVEKLAKALDVALDPAFEDAFYNGLGHPSPRQQRQVEDYLTAYGA